MWLQQRLKGLPGLLSSSWARRLLALLAFLLAASWYLGGAWPGLLLRLRPGGASRGAAGLCLQAETRAWRKGEARLLGEGPGQGPPGLVGNGHLLLDAQANRLWVAPTGGPAWPTDYGPLAQLRGPAGAESEAAASALLPKEGTWRKVRCIQHGISAGSCVTIREELLAHRGRPHLYLQRLSVDNPTDRLVALEVTGPAASSSSSSSSFSGRSFATSLEKAGDRQFYLSSGRALQPAGEKLVLVVVAAKKLVSRVQVAPKSHFEETLVSVVLSSEPIEAAQLDETFGRLREAAKREMMEVLPLRTEELVQEHRRAWDELFISGARTGQPAWSPPAAGHRALPALDMDGAVGCGVLRNVPFGACYQLGGTKMGVSKLDRYPPA